MSAEKISQADGIIRSHVVWASGAGMIPVPLADIAAVSAVQLDMIKQLSRVYGVEFSETSGKAMITTMLTSSVAKMGARVAIKFIPGIGSVLGGLSMGIFSGASTYALGQVYKAHFEGGGTFLDFDPKRFKKYYAEQFEKGKSVAEDAAKENPQGPSAPQAGFKLPNNAPQTAEKPAEKPNDALTQIKNLAQMKADGILTEEEFAQLKKKLIDAQ